MIRISDKVELWSRKEWGAQYSYRLGGGDDPRGGRRFIQKRERTHHFFHHSVIVDLDQTQNVWETDAEVRTNAVVIQNARPDLGGGWNDWPYNFGAYFRPHGKMTIVEGRGGVRSGAHTKYRDVRGVHHNISALATCIAGNTEIAFNIQMYVEALNDWTYYLKHNLGYSTVDQLHPPVGARPGYNTPSDSYGHISVHATACPGSLMYGILPQITFDRPIQEEDDMVDQVARDSIKILVASAHLQEDRLDSHQRKLEHHTAQINFIAAATANQQERLDAMQGSPPPQ
ncbi:hypothetical protein LCGC14_2065830, partial [marine sediment metagenome]